VAVAAERRSVAAGQAPAAAVRVPTGVYDPLLGMSWAQFGQMARAYHKCQGTGQLEAFPGDQAGAYAIYDSEPRVSAPENDILDGVDLSIGRIAKFAAWRRIEGAALVVRARGH
jgi:hypothetical protein